jgi:hypothetical protein
MCSTSFVSLYWSWNTHMCQVVCNPGMNFMKVHAFLLKGWFSLNTLCELVSNRKSSSSYEMILTRQAWQQGIMAGSFAWKTLIAFKMIAFSFDHHSPFDKPKNPQLYRIHFLLTLGRFLVLQKYIQWTYLISAGPVLTLYLAHSHCDNKYVNLSKWLWYQNFYFRQKSQLILG